MFAAQLKVALDLREDAESAIERSLSVDREVKDDQGRSYLRHVSTFRSPEGDIDGVVVTFQDMSDCKAIEQWLRNSEERSRALVETTSEATWETDAQGRAVEDSPARRAYTGQRPEEWIGYGWVDAVHPDEREGAERQWQEALSTGREIDVEFRLRGPEQGWRWTNIRAAPIRDEAGRIVKWVGMNIDITRRKEVEIERELLARELSHRVKNTLAIVHALAVQTNGRIQTAEEYRTRFLGRLKALSEAHTLLLDTNWQSTDLKTLVERALAAYRTNDPEIVSLDGAAVRLTSKQALGLALVLHELGTNAAKYGALSRSEGRLQVSWSLEAENERHYVQLVWQERHGPAVLAPATPGFGTQMIEQVCSYELEGDVVLDYAHEGLTCAVRFPLE